MIYMGVSRVEALQVIHYAIQCNDYVIQYAFRFKEIAD